MSLRARNRLAAMRRIQIQALDLFERDGFDQVSIEQIAELSEVSPSTVYRYFGTKEHIVVWEPDDTAISAAFLEKARELEPATAFREALIQVWSGVDEPALLLRRVRFIHSTPQVHAATIESSFDDRAELAAALAHLRGARKASLQDQVQAAACLAALDRALDAWQDGKGKRKLPGLIREAFDALAALELDD